MLVIHKNSKGEFYFTVETANGQTIAHSEGYTRKANCIKALNSLGKAVCDETDVIWKPTYQFFVDKSKSKKPRL